jgi:hypothetical protein
MRSLFWFNHPKLDESSWEMIIARAAAIARDIYTVQRDSGASGEKAEEQILRLR